MRPIEIVDCQGLSSGFRAVTIGLLAVFDQEVVARLDAGLSHVPDFVFRALGQDVGKEEGREKDAQKDEACPQDLIMGQP